MSTKNETNNPAARLFKFTLLAKRHPDPAQPALLWAHVFDIQIHQGEIDVDELSRVIERITEFRQLIEDTERGLKEFKDVDARHLEPFDALRRAVFISLLNLHTKQSGLFSAVTERHMTLLELAAVEWSKRKPDPDIDDQQLQDILAQARELFEEVKAADIQNPSLKKLLLSMLTAIEQAIQQYRTRGPERLEEGLVTILGQIHWNADLVDAAMADEGSKHWMKKVVGVASKLIAIVTFAEKGQKAFAAASPVVRLLLSRSPEIPPVDLQ